MRSRRSARLASAPRFHGCGLDDGGGSTRTDRAIESQISPPEKSKRMSGREIKATREIMAAAWNRRRPRRREGLLARSPTLIGVFVRIIAFAMLISLAVAPRSTAAAPNQVKTVV